MHVLYDRFYFNLYLLLSVCVCLFVHAGMSGAFPSGHRRAAEQRAADGALPAAGQLRACPSAQPGP